MSKAADLYTVLGVTPSATADELKAAYRELARRHHPDRARTYLQKIAATRRMQAVNAAYAVLRDPQRRAAYDAEQAALLRKPWWGLRRTAGAPPAADVSTSAGAETGPDAGRKAEPWPGRHETPPAWALGIVLAGAAITLLVSGRAHWSLAVFFGLAELVYCHRTDCIDDWIWGLGVGLLAFWWVLVRMWARPLPRGPVSERDRLARRAGCGLRYHGDLHRRPPAPARQSPAGLTDPAPRCEPAGQVLGAGARRDKGEEPAALEARRAQGGGMAFTYEIRADVPRNRLYMRLIGFMTEADARTVADALIAEYDKLKPGFIIVNDIRELKPTTQAATEQMRRAQEAAVQRGFGRAIRVIGDQVITHMQWSRTLRAAHGREAETASTMEEAERMLEGGAVRSAVKPEQGRRPE